MLELLFKAVLLLKQEWKDSLLLIFICLRAKFLLFITRSLNLIILLNYFKIIFNHFILSSNYFY